MTHGTAYRFTDADESAIKDRLSEVVDNWRQSSRDGQVLDDPAHVAGLVRIAAHAIGCTVYDIRPVEVDWIRERITEVLNNNTRKEGNPG